MSDYKYNHTIPRFMLDYWVDQAEPHKSVHVYDVASERPYLSTGEGKKPFSFAITPELYIHTCAGLRAVGLEKWLAGQEGSLAGLIRQVHNRQQIKPLTGDDQCKVLMALIGLQYRSAYNIRKMQTFIDSNDAIRNSISATPSRPVEQLVLENVIHLVNEQLYSVIPTEMIFFFAPVEENWIMGDRPYFQHEEIGYNFVVLTNRVLLGYKRSTHFTYQYQDVDSDFVKTTNEIITLNARDWLVAATNEQLDRYATIFKSDEWKRNVESEKIVLQPVRNLRSGWTIDR